MKARLIFYARYLIFWIFLFVFFRLLFVIYHFPKLQDASLVDYFLIFIKGLHHDISLTGYILIFPTLTLMLLSIFSNPLADKVISWYSCVIIIIISALNLIDLELYNYWRFRLDNAFAENLSNPKEMLANVGFIQVLLLLLFVGGMYYALYRLIFIRYIVTPIKGRMTRDWRSVVIFLVLLPALFLPIRGGISTAPINTGKVYFHQNIAVNHAAINPVWNLFYSFTEAHKLKFTVSFFDTEIEKEILQGLYGEDTKTNKILNTNRPNIIIVILESFSAGIIHELGGNEGIAPNFGKLVKEGVLFSNFYATGSSSPSGIGAILSGYPALPVTNILYYENKSQNLPGIAKAFAPLGYKSRFFYGGDIHFAHINSFLYNTGFHDIISHKDFHTSEYYSKWGVPDHIVFQRLLKETNNAQDPFFHVIFTLSSHEPFDVPMETVIEGNDNTNRFFNSVYYTDKSLGEFIENARKQPWWDSTLLVLVADHGTRIKDITHFDRERFHIPMLWLGGALAVRDSVIDKYASQTDIPKTLLNQLSVCSDDFKFSKDILCEKSRSFAYYTCQNGIGFLSDSLYMVYDLNSHGFLVDQGNTQEGRHELVKAKLQYVLRDFQER